FIEVGTSTPKPQTGNPFPRVFRLDEDRAVINRYGFNSLGHGELESNLQRQVPLIKRKNIIVGVNLGANKLSENKIDDYLEGLRRFYHLDMVKYFVINISSPNTPGLREFESKHLEKLLELVLYEKKLLEDKYHLQKPLLVKFSPDLNNDQVNYIAKVLKKFHHKDKNRSRLDGLIISNTTISRPESLKSSSNLLKEQGGLSGPPLKHISTEVIGKLFQLTDGKIPIIGVGGIESGSDAFEKIKAGASLLQLYTSMMYYGPPIANKVKNELATILRNNGYKNYTEAIGIDFRDKSKDQSPK
ncbi:dihydroorotate dehydrogenase (quinone), mitochondrial-like protein, partial [Sarcoptes scabiei]